MKIKKVRVLALCFALLFVISISACQKSNSETTTTATEENTAAATTKEATKETKTPIKLNIIYQASMFKEKLNDVFKAIEEKTGIIAEVQKVPDSQQGEQVIRSRVAAGELGDILCYWSSLVPSLGLETNFVDISNQPVTDYIIDSIKNPMSYKGKLYGVPDCANATSPMGVLYNKTLFAKASIQAPKTLDDFLANCEALKKSGVIPLEFALKDDWTAQFLYIVTWPYVYLNDPEWGDKMNKNQWSFEKTDIYKESFQFFVDLKEKGYINKADYLSTINSGGYAALVKGTAAMYMNGSWTFDMIKADFPDYDLSQIGAFAFPNPDGSGNNYINYNAPAGYYISKTISKEKQEAALRFLEAYSTPEIHSIYYSTEAGIPSFKGVTSNNNPAPMKDFIAYMNNNKAIVDMKTVLKAEILDLPKITQGVMAGAFSVENGLKELDKDFQRSAKAMKLEGF